MSFRLLLILGIIAPGIFISSRFLDSKEKPRQLSVLKLDNNSQLLLLGYRSSGTLGGYAVSLFYKRRDEPWRWYYVDHDCLTLQPWNLKYDDQEHIATVQWFGKAVSQINVEDCVQIKNGKVHSRGNIFIDEDPLKTSYPVKKRIEGGYK